LLLLLVAAVFFSLNLSASRLAVEDLALVCSDDADGQLGALHFLSPISLENMG
jgi:hypothetical protein